MGVAVGGASVDSPQHMDIELVKHQYSSGSIGQFMLLYWYNSTLLV